MLRGAEKTSPSRTLGRPARWRAGTGPARHDDHITALRHRAAFISPRSASGGLRRGRYLPLRSSPIPQRELSDVMPPPKRGQVQRQPATHPAGAVGPRTPAARWPPPCGWLTGKSEPLHAPVQWRLASSVKRQKEPGLSVLHSRKAASIGRVVRTLCGGACC